MTGIRGGRTTGVRGTVEFGVGGRVTGLIGEASSQLFSTVRELDLLLQRPDRVLIVFAGTHDRYGHRIPVRQVVVVRDLSIDTEETP